MQFPSISSLYHIFISVCHSVCVRARVRACVWGGVEFSAVVGSGGLGCRLGRPWTCSSRSIMQYSGSRAAAALVHLQMFAEAEQELAETSGAAGLNRDVQGNDGLPRAPSRRLTNATGSLSLSNPDEIPEMLVQFPKGASGRWNYHLQCSCICKQQCRKMRWASVRARATGTLDGFHLSCPPPEPAAAARLSQIGLFGNDPRERPPWKPPAGRWR